MAPARAGLYLFATVAVVLVGLGSSIGAGATPTRAPSGPSSSSAIIGNAYTALTPCRIEDTRPTGVVAGSNTPVTVTGTFCGQAVPSGATAIVVNATVTQGTNNGFLTLYPTGSASSTSNLNFATGQTVANLATVPVGSGGSITVFDGQPSGSVQFILDLQGYYAAPASGSTAGQFVPLNPPARALDTRSSSPVGPGGSIDIQITGANGVPASGVSAVVGNLTGTQGTAGTYETVWPKGATQPTASNLNLGPGQTRPNRVIVPVGTGGKISVFNANGSQQLVFDINGYYTDATAAHGAGSLFTPITPPNRVEDTRTDGKTLGPGGKLTLTFGSGGPVPAGATAIVGNLTDADATAGSYFSFYPGSGSPPGTSDLNFGPGEINPNMVQTALSSAAVSVFNAVGSADAILDLSGFFAPGPTVTVTANPGTITGNGSDQSTITVSVTDFQGTGVSGDGLTLMTSGSCGSLSATTGTTNGAGQATFTYTATTNTGSSSVTCTITATEGDTGASGSTGVIQTVTNQAYHITPNANQNLIVSTSTSTQGQVTYTVSNINSTNTPTGHVDITLFPSTGGNAPVNNSGIWTFTSSGGAGHAGTAVGQATSNSTGLNGNPTTSPSSPNQGACQATSSCNAYIVNINGTPTTNAPDQVNDVNAASNGTITFTLDSFQPDDAIPVVFSEPAMADSGTLLIGANGQPQSGYPFAVGGDANWNPNAPPAPSGTFHGWYVQSVNTSNGTFIACNTLPPTSSATCNTFTMHSGDTYTYPANNDGWDNNDSIVNISMAQFQTDLSGPLNGQLVPTDNGGGCGGNWPIFNHNGPSGANPTLCTAGTGSNNTDNSSNPDIVDISVGSTSHFGFDNFLNGESCVQPPAPSPTNGSTGICNQDAPAAPTGLNGTASVVGGGAQVALHWNAVPNQDVSGDTTNEGPGQQAEYDIYRATGAGTPAFIGTNLPATGPPGTTFTDTGAAGSTTYNYYVVAVSSDESGGVDHQVAGPASAAFQVTTPAALPAPPVPQTPTTPISVQTTITPCPTSPTCPGGNTTGSLLTGDTFKVNFNGPITVSGTASFTLTDQDGTQGTVTCGTNATCSASANVMTVVMTAPPVIGLAGSDGTLDYQTGGSTWIAFTSETGVSNGAGQWNLPWSGCRLNTGGCASGRDSHPSSLNPTVSDIRDMTKNTSTTGNVVLPGHLPHISGVTGAVAGSSTVTVTSYAGATVGATISVYDVNGNLLGSATRPGSGSTAISLSSPLAVGQVIQLVYTNPSTATTAAMPSQTAQVLVSWSYTGTQTDQGSWPGGGADFKLQGDNTLGNLQTVPVVISSNVPNSTVYLKFLADPVGGGCTLGTASVGSTALTNAYQLFQTDGSGNLTINYTTSSCADSITGTDTIVAASETAASFPNHPLMTASENYTYAGPNAPTVTSVSPINVPETISKVITITGTHLSTATGVEFCRNLGVGGPADITVAPTSVGASAVTANSPIESFTSDTQCDVQVVTTKGETPSTHTVGTDALNFIAPPTVTAITWSSGPTAGGQHVVIQGTNFASAGPDGPDVVNIGGTNTNALNNHYPDTTSITTITPAGAGTASVTVTDAFGQFGTLSNAYNYVNPPAFSTVVQSAASNQFETFNEPICRNVNFATDNPWTVSGSISGTHTVTADSIPACNGAVNNHATALSGLLTTNLGGSVSNFVPGETVTVTFNPSGATDFQDSAAVGTGTGPQALTYTYSSTPRANIISTTETDFSSDDASTLTFDVPVCNQFGIETEPIILNTNTGDTPTFTFESGDGTQGPVPTCNSNRTNGVTTTTVEVLGSGTFSGTATQVLVTMLNTDGIVDDAAGNALNVGITETWTNDD